MGEPHENILLIGLHYCLPEEDAIELLLKKYGIAKDYHIKMWQYDLCFYEIQSENMRNNLDTCFGEYRLFEDIDNPINTDFKKALIIDAAFWVAFIKEYVVLFKEIWLCHFHEDVQNTVKPLVEINIDELEVEHLLKLEENQTIVIRKRE